MMLIGALWLRTVSCDGLLWTQAWILRLCTAKTRYRYLA